MGQYKKAVQKDILYSLGLYVWTTWANTTGSGGDWSFIGTVFGQQKSRNNRFYPRELLERVIEDAKHRAS